MWWLWYRRFVLGYINMDGCILDILVGLLFSSSPTTFEHFLRLLLWDLVLAAFEWVRGHFRWVGWQDGLLLEMLRGDFFGKLLVTHAQIAIIAYALPPTIVVRGERRWLLLRDSSCQILDRLHGASLAIDVVPTYGLWTAAKLLLLIGAAIDLDTVWDDLVVAWVLLHFGQTVFVTWQSGLTAWHYIFVTITRWSFVS